MPTEYIIKGEAGKTLNASDHLLGTDLKAVNASLRFENLGPDVLQWTCRTEDLDAGDSTIPDVGQRIELWNAAGSTRHFRGWVTQARATNYGVQVVAEGPWMWLQKIDITSSLVQVTTDDRPTIIFNEANVATSVTALLNRAIALSAPIAVGTIASCFTIPKLQLSMMTCADVLAELMRWVPDCVGWWNYSGSGTPSFNLTRRSGMSARTFAIGTDPVEDYDLTGRPDLVPSKVAIKYVQRGSDGVPEYAAQSAGSDVVGRIQTIGLSGKELDTFLPPDEYANYTAATAVLNTSLAINNAVKSIILQVVESRAAFNGYPRASFDSDAKLSSGETLYYGTYIGQDMSNASYYSQLQPMLRFTNPVTGAAVSTSGKRLVIGQAQPDWAIGVYANAEKVRITGRLYRAQNKERKSSTDGVLETYTEPAWSQQFAWSVRENSEFYYWGETKPIQSTVLQGTTVFFNFLDFEIEAILTTSNYASPTTVYKPQDYEYLSPPTGLATNLLSAQNFTPYEGSISLNRSSLTTLTNFLPYLYRVTGAQTSLATADAMAKAVMFDLAQSTEQIEIGAPARFNFGVLGGKVRQTPQTNITIN